MKLTRPSLLLLLPSVAAAWPQPPLPEVQLVAPPLTLVANALDKLPRIMDAFAAVLPPLKPQVVMVSHMPILVPNENCDPGLVHPVDPAVDYKLTIKVPEVGDGK